MTFFTLTIYNDNPSDFIPNRDHSIELNILPNYDMFPENICDGCDIPTEDAHASGHMVPLGLANFLLVETNPFPKLS